MTGQTSLRRMGQLKLEETHIHLLRTRGGQFQTPISRLLSLLPLDECQRYQSFELESRRQEFLLSRLFVRHLLAFYTGRKMGDLELGYGAQGKPFLKNSHLQFSLSHTPGFIALSLGRGAMGMDVEKIDSGYPAQKRVLLLAKRFFSLAERAYLQSFPLELQHLAFLRVFTMKEAYAKAFGLGISFPLNCLTVPLTDQEQSRMGSWEWFNQITGDFCLSHVVEKQASGCHRRQTYYWDESFLSEIEDIGSTSLLNRAIA